MREKVSRLSVFCFVWCFVSRDGSQSHFVDWLHPSAAERSLSQHLFPASVEGSLPEHGQICTRRHQLEVGEMWFSDGEKRWCVMRRGRKQGDSRFIWGVGLPLDGMTFQCVRMWNIRIWDEEVRSRQTSLSARRMQPMFSRCMNNASPAVACSVAFFILPSFYNYDSFTPPPPLCPPPSPLLLLLLLLPFAISLETVLREEVGASLVWQSSEGPRHPFPAISTQSFPWKKTNKKNPKQVSSITLLV